MHNSIADTAVSRSILLGARIRFPPSGASIRNQAIERIIEQNLVSAEAAGGLAGRATSFRPMSHSY